MYDKNFIPLTVGWSLDRHVLVAPRAPTGSRSDGVAFALVECKIDPAPIGLLEERQEGEIEKDMKMLLFYEVFKL